MSLIVKTLCVAPLLVKCDAIHLCDEMYLLFLRVYLFVSVGSVTKASLAESVEKFNNLFINKVQPYSISLYRYSFPLLLDLVISQVPTLPRA